MNNNHRRYNNIGMNNIQLRLFVKIAETGSFTKAGQELNMTQPAVSRSISSLESELDVKLLIRHRRNGLILTDIGKRILLLARDILNGFDNIEQEISSEKGLETGIIRIGAFPVASAYFVPKIISTITDKYPHIEFRLYEGTVTEVKEWLESRYIDVGFIIPPHEELDIFPLFKEKLYAVLRDDHPLQEKSIIHVTELEHEPMLVCKAGYEPPVVDLFMRANAQINVKFVVKNYNTALNMVQEGLALAVMSELSLLQLPPNVVMRELHPDAHREVHLAVSSADDTSIAVRLFIDTALALFAQPDIAASTHNKAAPLHCK